MFEELKSFIKSVRSLSRRGTCSHEGETQEFCGQCGADLRETTSYECRLCSLLGRNTMYVAKDAPDFCRKCGAPRFTFVRTKKKGSSEDDRKKR